MTDYILSIEQGTTLTQATLYNRSLVALATASEGVTMHHTAPDLSEQDPDSLWRSVVQAGRAVIKKSDVDPQAIAGLTLTNQRETTLVWDRQTGESVYPAISWQDRRTENLCATWRDDGREPLIQGKTGLILDPYFSGPKLRWILDNVPGARTRAEAGELCFGTVDSYILWRLTNGQVHATDATNASRTLLFNIHHQQWDAELLHEFDIPAAMLPEVKDSSGDFGHAGTDFLGVSLPITGVIGDQQGAMVGQHCLKPGEAKATYSSGCFVLVNTGDQPVISQNRLLTTLAYRLHGQPTYAVEGSVFMAGSIINWLRDDLNIIRDARDVERMARDVPLDQSEVVVPAFTGLGAPHWDHQARGAIFGLTRSTRADHLVAAALRSVAFQTEDLLKAMRYDSIQVNDLKVDGGLLANDWFLQSLSDITGARVLTCEGEHAAALGAAMMGALRLGWFNRLSDMGDPESNQAVYTPHIDDASRDAVLRRWDEALFRIQAPLA